MDITGYDTILFTFSEPCSIVRTTIDSLRRRHSDLALDLEFVQPDGDSITDATTEQCLDAILSSGHVIVYVYTSTIMRKHLEERGYTVSSSGDGPLALHVRRRQNVAFRLGAIDEVYGSNGLVGPPSPYSGWLSSSEVFEITVVTSGDPEQHVPSRDVVKLIIRTCTG